MRPGRRTASPADRSASRPPGCRHGRRQRGTALLRTAAVHRPRQVDHQVRHRRRRQDRLVAPGGQFDACAVPSPAAVAGASSMESTGTSTKSGVLVPCPGAGAVALGVDLHRTGRLCVAPPQAGGRGDERGLDDSWCAKPYSWSVPRNPRAARLPASAGEDVATPVRRSRRVPIVRRIRARQRRRAVSGLGRATSAACLRCGRRDRRWSLGSTSLERTEPTWPTSPCSHDRNHRRMSRLTDSRWWSSNCRAHRSDASVESRDHDDRLVGAQSAASASALSTTSLCGDHRRRPPRGC